MKRKTTTVRDPYTAPQIEVILFEAEDVITTSTPVPEPLNDPDLGEWDE